VAVLLWIGGKGAETVDSAALQLPQPLLKLSEVSCLKQKALIVVLDEPPPCAPQPSTSSPGRVRDGGGRAEEGGAQHGYFRDVMGHHRFASRRRKDTAAPGIQRPVLASRLTQGARRQSKPVIYDCILERSVSLK